MRSIVRHLTIALVGFLVIASSLIAVGQSWSGSDFIVQYSSYIPVDHIDGPLSCPWVLNIDNEAYIPLIYLGDKNRTTYRTTESIQISTVTQQSMGFLPLPGETRNYDAVNSPVNHSTLSNLRYGEFLTGDEDGTPHDCFLFNDNGFDNPSNYHQQTTVDPSGGVVHYWGTGDNPLEAPDAPITWDLTITVNADARTAYVRYDHTCFPAHIVKVNGHPVYDYVPERADLPYIIECLTPQPVGRAHKSGTSLPVSVPVY